MEKITFANVAGFVLAAAFALVMGISMSALLVGEYMNTIVNAQSQTTMRIIGFAGAFAALTAWWVQQFPAKRSFLVRFLFALFVFIVAFCSFGGMLRVIYSHITYPNQQDWSLSGLYWASQSDLVSFVLYMMVPPRPAYAALMLFAAVYLAVFGPRDARA